MCVCVIERQTETVKQRKTETDCEKGIKREGGRKGETERDRDRQEDR